MYVCFLEKQAAINYLFFLESTGGGVISAKLGYFGSSAWSIQNAMFCEVGFIKCFEARKHHYKSGKNQDLLCRITHTWHKPGQGLPWWSSISIAKGTGLIPGQGTKIPHAMQKGQKMFLNK